MRKIAVLLPLLLLASACRGSKPVRFGESKFGFSAVILRGRIITPTGEIKEGRMSLNLESESADNYRLNFEPGETTVLRVEPDIYRLHPTRSIFGRVQRQLTVVIAGRAFRVPFPRSILRREQVDLRPTKVAAIGILEAKLMPIQKGKPPKIVVRLIDDIDTKRELLEEVIEKMMDPRVSVSIRSASVSWTRAIEDSLIDLQGLGNEEPAYKRAK
jgi:hypothetical protein